MRFLQSSKQKFVRLKNEILFGVFEKSAQHFRAIYPQITLVVDIEIFDKGK